MQRILHFIYGLGIGGAETFIYNLIANSNVDRYVYGIAIQNPNITNQRLKDLLEKMGIQVHVIPSFPAHMISQAKELRKICKDCSYDIIHLHANAALNPVPFIVGINQSDIELIVHSHSSMNNLGGRIGLLIHEISKKLFMSRNIQRIACSDKAGYWMFGKRSFTVIKNAIDITKYAYNNEGRKRIRNKYNIADEDIVLGSIARLVEAKNHVFMIDLFKQYNMKNPKSKLLIVGDGPLRSIIEHKVKQIGVVENVVFAGSQIETCDYYSAMDCFLMPSLYEGLGFTAIEAQANGLPVIASDKVPQEIKVSDNVIHIPCHTCVRNTVSEEYSEWLDSIDKLIKLRQIHELPADRNPLSGSCFDIHRQISEIEAIYENGKSI